MAVDDSLHLASVSLYHFMCQHIVGTEETMRKKSLMNTIWDNIASGGSSGALITSGSRGEGLDITESDLDMIVVDPDFIAHEDTGNRKLDPQKINLIMEMNHTKPGYTQLRFVDLSPSGTITEMCTYSGKSWYLSSDKWKYQKIIKEYSMYGIDNIHRPCLSDRNGLLDAAFCLHNTNWISLAEEWITRPNRLWLSSDVKLDIIEHGVLYVPIGCKGSDNEELEWRISFSVAEKLLIYSFSHTQLICYTLMKILLKDVIDNNSGCKDLLCSYFIKTIILLVSEETI